MSLLLCGSAGFTFELCAGLIDKAKSLREIVVEEVHEECGYKVSAADVSPMASAISASGTAGAEHAMFFAKVGGRKGGGRA